MNKIAVYITQYVINKGVVNEEQRNIYEYGFTIALETGLSVLISFFISVMLHMVLEGILFFIIFVPLRSYAGGLHMDNYISCFSLSCITYTGILMFAKQVELPIFFCILAITAMELFIYYMYPVENINREVDEEENMYFKIRLKKYLIFDLLLVIIFSFFRRNEYIVLITATFCMVVITMILGKIKNILVVQDKVKKNLY